ncbi:MAG: oligosaccharide flippase family protein [Opitutales bacterium]|nr:oligosaccharide flippase family protein [Opitutales bacterium]
MVRVAEIKAPEARVSRKKAAGWHLFFSYTTVAYGIISGLVMVPLYLRFIPYELYGAWLATGNILNWVLVVDPGLSTVIMQRVGQSYGADRLNAVGAYALSGLLLTAIIVLGVILVGLIMAPHIAGWVNLLEADLARTLQINFVLGLIAGGITLFAFSVGVVNLGLQRSFAHGMVFLTANLLTLAVTIVLLFKGFGLYAISLGLLTRALVFSLGGAGYMLCRLKREAIHLNFQRATMREMLGLLSFTSLGKIGGLLSKNMDAFLIARFLGPDKVPIYILTRRGMEVAITMLGRTGNAFSPSLSHLSGESDPGKMRFILNRLLYINLWILGLAFGGFLAFNEGFITVWVGQELFAGSVVSTLFCLFMVLTLLFTLMQTLCVALGDIKRNAIVQFVQALIIFSCMLFGTYFFGFVGAALAPIIGYLSISLWYYPRSLTKRGHLQSNDLRRLTFESVLCLGLGLLLALPFSQASITSWIGLILWASAFLLLYSLVLMSLRPMLRKEVRLLKDTVLRKIIPQKPSLTS